MSAENVKLVERMLALFDAGDAEGALACFAPDVVVDASRRPDGATGQGLEALGRIVADWTGAFDDWSQVIEECRDLGDEVVVLATQRGRGRGSGVEVEARYAMVYGVRDGKIVSFTLDPDPSAQGYDAHMEHEANLGDAQSSNPPDDPEMIESDADPLDTDVEDADLFLGEDDDEDENAGDET